MDSLYILIPIALVFCVIAVGTFFWAVNHRQYDDLDREARSILFEDETPPPPPEEDRASAEPEGEPPRKRDHE